MCAGRSGERRIDGGRSTAGTMGGRGVTAREIYSALVCQDDRWRSGRRGLLQDVLICEMERTSLVLIEAYYKVFSDDCRHNIDMREREERRGTL